MLFNFSHQKITIKFLVFRSPLLVHRSPFFYRLVHRFFLVSFTVYRFIFCRSATGERKKFLVLRKTIKMNSFFVCREKRQKTWFTVHISGHGVFLKRSNYLELQAKFVTIPPLFSNPENRTLR